MNRHLNLLLAAAENVAHNRAGYAVASAGLVLGLAFLLGGVAIDAGLKREALAGIDAGADVYCTWDVFGRDMPLPRPRAEALRSVAGVVRAVPRIVGRVRLGDEWAVVIGLPAEELARVAPAGSHLDEGEILVGQSIARLAGLAAGQRVVLESDSAVVFNVAAVMAAPASYWSARAILCELDEAARLFGDPSCYTDVCLHTRPGQAGLVAERVRRIHSRYRVQTRSLVRHYILEGLTLRSGVFPVLGAWALVLALPLFAVTSFQGLVVRRREIGLLKAEGWTTWEVLEMVALENLVVSLASAGVALLAALVWVDVLGAPLLGAYFLPDWPLEGERPVPARFLPAAPVLAVAFSLAVTMPGSLLATWRTAIISPSEAIR